ncbi:LLM class flavin-dependent oxidoreductase [Halotalea alkalilenta]|uniref:N5,N10-methylene tetrahydromethanopterin reductase n=1 Tax=Halotalea alkalilenta TaxID=376489 RepID=A0A172YIR7_9GAMM|nr:LLM class flavin-dependent oxidoreductase [Halotalea alkalilenta]ANF59093.1 N5,N10-methylene tetrahydromethanopterin reductase [Halotalea alkalilenta]
MPTCKPLLLNAFNMNCVGHINHGLWAHPRDRSIDYHSLDYWTGLARTLERGGFDGLFLADILGVYDVYQEGIELTLAESIQLPVNDPLLLVPAMAQVTEHLGFGVTVNLSYETPYSFARRFSTLDHLTRGRIGWNIVTGYLDSAARAMGLDGQLEHDRRYERAEEFMAVVYALWEGSWEDSAVLRDKAGRRFADGAKVHEIDHHGEFYRLRGYHLSEPSRQRTPVLYQAGSSGRGQAFAARHAECVFISLQDRAKARELVRSLRRQAVEAGRRADDLKIFLGATAIVADSDAEARERLAEYQRYANPEAGLAHFAASTGIDFSRFGLDEPIRRGNRNAIQSAVDNLTAAERAVTPRALLEQHALGGRYTPLVGSGATVADELARWVEEVDIDGFNLARTVVPECFDAFVDLVVPELRERGLVKRDYPLDAQGRPQSLRQRLFGAGDRLPQRHPAAAYRRSSAGASPSCSAAAAAPETL